MSLETNMALNWYDTNYDTWECTKCRLHFIDPEDYPHLAAMPDDEEDVSGLEPRLYWLNITEPICSTCAITARIPPIDEV